MRYKNTAINELLDDNKITQEEYNILFEKLEYKDNFLAALKKVLLLFKKEKHIHLDHISFPNLPELSNFYSYIVNILGVHWSHNLREIGFWYCNFYSKIWIHEVFIKHHLHFGKATFHKKVTFNKSIFEKRIDFLETNFKEDIRFGGVKFKDEAHFWKSNADKLIAFQSITCSKIFSINKLGFQKIDMDNARFKEVNFIDLVGRENNKDISLNKTHFDNKETTIILRTHLEKENYISEANKYFKIGQELYIDYLLEKDNTAPNRYSTLIVLYLNKFISNFGTDWIRPILVMFIFGFLASFLYIVFSNNPTLFISDKLSISKDDILFWTAGGFSLSIVMYLTYHYKSWGLLMLTILGYIGLIIFSQDSKLITNDISKLINPLNIFKGKEYFEDIAPYGMMVKLIMATLIYQFIMAFRQNTRRK